MKYQLTRHLAASSHQFHTDRVLLENLFHETRFSTDNSVWDMLESYRHPSELGDTDLEIRAMKSQILTPVGQTTESNDITESFERVTSKYLKNRKCEPSSELFARLEQLSEHCRPLGTIGRGAYFIWQDPRRVFEIMLEHFRVYLDLELGQPETAEIAPRFVQRSLGRPECEATLEQQVCSLQTSWRRAKKIAEECSESDRILVLGDDDLVSHALLEFPVGSVEVLEIDSKLVRHLKKAQDPRLKVTRRDLSLGIPKDLRGRYDVVVSDPMYAASGMNLFLNSCVQALKPSCGSRLYLSTYPPLLEDSALFFEKLSECGLEIESTHKNFSRYPFPDYMCAGTSEGLTSLGYHYDIVECLLRVPYLYADLFKCKWAQSS